MLVFKRYAIQSPALKPWIKFIWLFEADEYVSIKNKLLPTDSTDIILNMSTAINYLVDGQVVNAENLHVNGIRDKYSFIMQEGVLKVFGISFFSYGLYPFFRIPLFQLNSRILDLKECNYILAKNLEAILMRKDSVNRTLLGFEKILEMELDLNRVNLNHTILIKKFAQNNYEKSVSLFCHDENVCIKTFERACFKYTGLNPKTLQRIGRFQATSNQLIYGTKNNAFSDIIYDDYYDQAHFIKEFNIHTGVSPTRFLKEGISIKENANVIAMR